MAQGVGLFLTLLELKDFLLQCSEIGCGKTKSCKENTKEEGKEFETLPW
jgi:hypothetical protein